MRGKIEKKIKRKLFGIFNRNKEKEVIFIQKIDRKVSLKCLCPKSTFLFSMKKTRLTLIPCDENIKCSGTYKTNLIF